MREFNYEEIISTIENTHRFGNKTGVEITADMMDKLAYPQKGIPYIHVAGTNGKGSTCAFLTSIFKEAGFKVGTFTSPHLIDFEERIVINGQMIPKSEVTRIGNLILNTSFDVTPTYFDYCLAIAIIYFREQGCDLMVIETGLGGALDSTNALGTPDVSVITKIGYDHVGILGDSLDKIAGEKAGIIKKGSCVVLERQEPGAEKVLLDRIKSESIEKHSVVSDLDVSYVKGLKLKILGTHQYENASAALLAARLMLEKLGADTGRISLFIEQGLKKATWPGRMELLSEEPFVMVDGAHNGHGVLALKGSLEELYPNEKFDLFMAVMADKDYPNMIEEMLSLAQSFTTITLDNDRAAQGEQLAAYICNKQVEVHTLSDMNILIEELRKKSHTKKIVFGSLYFVGEVKKLFQKKEIFE